MVAPIININRYRLIILLYVIFVCLSVLNIPVSLLDSNYHLIKTLEYQEKSRLKEVDFANQIISGENDSLFRDTAKVYFAIQDKIHETFLVMDSIDKVINQKFIAQGTTIFKEFNSRRKLENIFIKDAVLARIKVVLFNLVKFLDAQPFQIDSTMKSLVPVSDEIIALSGSEISWDRYLWLHKPIAISYMHIKRVKVLLLDNEYLYQNAALRTISVIPSYYSKSLQKSYINNKAEETTKVIDNGSNIDSSKLAELMKKIKMDSIKFIAQRNNLLEKNQSDSANRFDDFFQKIMLAMHAEHLYAGVTNPLLQNLNYEMGTEFALDIYPVAEINRKGNDYGVVFKSKGDYVLRFSDLRKGKKKQLFEKKVAVSLLPNPTVRLSGDNNLKDMISVKDLFIANRLVASIGVSDLSYFPGRFNGYRVTRITKTNDQQSIYNYGEVFQSETQGLIRGLEKGDMILFDRITLILQDGTTRATNSVVYKIDD